MCEFYKPRRVKLGDHNPECPVHSPVGRVMGFFEYVFTQTEQQKGEEKKAEEVVKFLGGNVTKEQAQSFITAFNDKYRGGILTEGLVGEPPHWTDM